MAGHIWFAGRMFETTALDESSSFENQLVFPYEMTVRDIIIHYEFVVFFFNFLGIIQNRDRVVKVPGSSFYLVIYIFKIKCINIRCVYLHIPFRM